MVSPEFHHTSNNLNQYTAAGSTSYQYDPSGNMTYDGQFDYGYDPENRLVMVHKSRTLPPLTIGQALESPLTYTTGGDAPWLVTQRELTGRGDFDCVYSNDLAAEQSNWLQTTVEGQGTLSFWWKAASSDSGSALTFWIDGQARDALEGDQNTWQQKTYTITGSGPHTLKWTFSRSSDEYNSGMGFVDCVQWTGSALPAPEPPLNCWHRLAYQYDAAGRRVAKSYNEELITKYIYDGDHCIAEYDAFGHLRRKYIYGPGVDEPISVIEAGGSYAGTYYYHFDGLGSVVALTSGNVDHMGETVQVYEYDVYGRVGATDASHPNRFLFTGREYDKETGLYYYRARYYNPQIGRFLQTDPIGYGGGMNCYAYCGNNSTNYVDPSGLKWEDPAVRIILYDSSVKYWFDCFTAGISSDPFWDVRIDIGGAAAAAAGYSSSADYIKHIFTDPNELKKMIEAQEPGSEYTLNGKIYDWTQITIEGLWIWGHGDTYGNNDGQSGTCVPGNAAFETIFSSIGQGLNANHGAGAPIHLRQCTAPFGQSGADWAYTVMENAAKWSGHNVTAPLGCLVEQPLAQCLDPVAGGWGYAPWTCSYGFGMVKATTGLHYSWTGGDELGQSTRRIINAAPGITVWGPVPNHSSVTCVW